MTGGHAGGDEVDDVVAAWTREQPHVDVSPMEVWSRISRLAQLLDRERAATFTSYGLAVWEFDMLAALRRAGDPYQLTPGELLRQTHVTSGTMTNRIKRLQDRGLVRRQSNPTDGRGALVCLTAEGQQRVDAAIGDLVTAERRLGQSLNAAESAYLAATLRRLLAAQDSPR